MNSKQLHKHALPIMFLAAGLFVASGIAVSRLIVRSYAPGVSVAQLLTERQFSVRPATNGLVHISRYTPGEQADNDRALAPGGSGGGLSQIGTVGQSADLNASLNQ